MAAVARVSVGLGDAAKACPVSSFPALGTSFSAAAGPDARRVPLITPACFLSLVIPYKTGNQNVLCSSRMTLTYAAEVCPFQI